MESSPISLKQFYSLTVRRELRVRIVQALEHHIDGANHTFQGSDDPAMVSRGCLAD